MKIVALFCTALLSFWATNCPGQFGQPLRTSEILGATIRGSHGQRMGRVSDLGIDLQNGRIVIVALTRGGILGVDTEVAAVPPETFEVADHGKIIRLNVPGLKLDTGPGVDFSRWGDITEQPRVEEIYRYYGVIPYFFWRDHLPRNVTGPIVRRLGEVDRATRLSGIETMNRQDQKVGKIADFVVDLTDGRVIEVMIASGRFPGSQEELSAVPPQTLRYDETRGVVTLNVSREDMERAPHFSSRHWPLIGRQQAAEVYRAYHVEPYFEIKGASASAN